MAIKTVLFDLDGTLLPMDLDEYLARYFQLMVEKMARNGYDPQQIAKAIQASAAAMVQNNGSRTNEETFWNALASVCGDEIRQASPLLEEFYEKEFQLAKEVCGFDPEAAPLVRRCREMGLRVILATSPLYPRIATESRIRWAGLEPEDFDYITTFETSHYCKPNPDYYRELIRTCHLEPSQCLMVGNDVTEDMVAKDTGMDVFLLPAWLINKENKDISQYPHGDFRDLIRYIEKNVG